jgi:hypothetical protein
VSSSRIAQPLALDSEISFDVTSDRSLLVSCDHVS